MRRPQVALSHPQNPAAASDAQVQVKVVAGLARWWRMWLEPPITHSTSSDTTMWRKFQKSPYPFGKVFKT